MYPSFPGLSRCSGVKSKFLIVNKKHSSPRDLFYFNALVVKVANGLEFIPKDELEICHRNFNPPRRGGLPRFGTPRGIIWIKVARERSIHFWSFLFPQKASSFDLLFYTVSILHIISQHLSLNGRLEWGVA